MKPSQSYGGRKMIEAIKQLDAAKVFVTLDNGSRLIGTINYVTDEHIELKTYNNIHHIRPDSVKTIRRYKE